MMKNEIDLEQQQQNELSEDLAVLLRSQQRRLLLESIELRLTDLSQDLWLHNFS